MLRFLARRFYDPNDGGGGAQPSPTTPAEPAPAAPGTAPPAQTAADPAPAGTAARPKLFDQLPKGRAVAEKFYAYDSLDKLMGALESADERLSRAIVRPGKDAKPEEIQAFLDGADIPPNPDGYDLTADGLGIPDADKFLSAFKAKLHEAGASRPVAKAMFELFTGMAKAGQASQEAALKARDENFKQGFLAIYGGDEAKAQTGVLLAEKFAKRLGSKEAVKDLAELGAFRKASIVKAFADIEDRAFSDPQFIGGRGGGAPAPAGRFGNNYDPSFLDEFGG